MFIKNLGQRQKELFLLLAYKAAEANGEIAADEKEMMEEFSKEANIPPIYSADISLEELLKELSEISSESEKRIIALETLSILKSDTEIDMDERAFFSQVANKLDISNTEADKMEELLIKYTDIYEEIYKFVFGMGYK